MTASGSATSTFPLDSGLLESMRVSLSLNSEWPTQALDPYKGQVIAFEMLQDLAPVQSPQVSDGHARPTGVD